MTSTSAAPQGVAQVIVTNTNDLIEALSTAVDGESILVAPGSYSGVALSDDKFSGAGVTVQSELSSDPATFTDLTLSNSSGVTFNDLNFSTATDAAGPYGALNTNEFQVISDQNINFTNLKVHGDPNGTLATTVSGFLIRNSQNVAIKYSEFSYLHYAIGHLGDIGLTIQSNYFHNIYDDGIRGGGSSAVNIRQNFFTDFHEDPSDTDHPDCIQFWTSGTNTSVSSIQIVGNLYIQGSGGLIQGIFLRDEVGDLPYKNVIISANMLAGTGYNGIAIYGGADAPSTSATISGNTVEDLAPGESRILVFDSGEVAMSNNTAPEYLFSDNSNLSKANDQLNGVATDGGESLLMAWLKVNAGFNKEFPGVAAENLSPSIGRPTKSSSPADVVGFATAMSSFTNHSGISSEPDCASFMGGAGLTLASPRAEA